MDVNLHRQIDFLNRIKELIPPNNSLVHILAELLDTSTDSIYRRIRGETTLTFEEVGILCKHFKISFDSFVETETGSVTFNYTLMDDGEISFEKHLTTIRDDLKIVKLGNNPRLIYACEDIPLFHLLYKFGLGSFKMMYWMKAILDLPSYENTKFSFNVVSPELKALSKEIYEIYCSIPSVEIWTDRTIYGTLKQIEYFWESGMFESDQDAIKVIESLKGTIEHIENQAKAGTKVVEKLKTDDKVNNFDLYYSDIALTNNCALVETDSMKAVYLGHFSFTTMKTTNATYCDQTSRWLNNIRSKSTLISAIAEKTRYKFFQRIYKNIDELLEVISDPKK